MTTRERVIFYLGGWLIGLEMGIAMCIGAAHANQIDYFCIFANAAAAQADVPVGAYWNASTSSWDLSRTFPGISVVTPQAVVNGISSLTGFWIIVSTAGPSAALDADTNCVMKLDRDVSIAGGSFVLGASIMGSNRTNLHFSPVPHGSRYPSPLGQ